MGTEDWVPALLRVSPAPRDAAYCTHRSSMTPCERTSSSRQIILTCSSCTSRPDATVMRRVRLAACAQHCPDPRSTAERISRATLTRGSPTPGLLSASLSQRTVTSARRCSDGPDCDQRCHTRPVRPDGKSTHHGRTRLSCYAPVSYTHLTLPTIYSV